MKPVWRRGERAVSLCGLITPRSLDQNQLRVFLHFGGFAEAASLIRQTLNTVTLHRHGAGVARRAHNPEVTGSKPVAGILHFGGFAEAASLLRQTLNTVMQYRCGAEASAPFHFVGS